jgi:hypothetical protein
MIAMMRRSTALAVAASGWVAALAAAGALTYDLNRPLPLGRAAPAVELHSSLASIAPAAEGDNVLTMPLVTIVGHAHLASAPGATPTSGAR